MRAGFTTLRFAAMRLSIFGMHQKEVFVLGVLVVRLGRSYHAEKASGTAASQWHFAFT